MSDIWVDSAARTLTFDGRTIACAIGKGGSCAAAEKQEGDGCSPRGRWPIRGVLLRPGRVVLGQPLQLPWRWTRPSNGWSDDVRDPAYNRPVHLPHPFSAERLQREDEAYDVIVVLGHNDDPPVPGKGSAIFFHLWKEGQPTEGCVAIAREEMLALLPRLEPKVAVVIR